MAKSSSDEKINFNSHAHVERDDSTNELTDSMKNFNSHAHVERDLQSDTFHNDLVISTHTLTWSVTGRFYHIVSADIEFQLTRSRGA